MELIRLCLKHFRQQGYHGAFKALQEHTKVELEHPIITDLHRALIEKGDFVDTEKFIRNCIQSGLVDDHINHQNYKHTWKLAKATTQPGKCKQGFSLRNILIKFLSVSLI